MPESNFWQFAADQGLDGIPREAPPWFASQEQYEAILERYAMDLGPSCITATGIDVEHLDENARMVLLGQFALRPTLEFVSSTYARLDAAALKGGEAEFERKFVQPLSGDLARKAKAAIRTGRRFIPPPAMTQLIREVVEWCAEDSAADGLGAVDFVHLVLSINGEQEAQNHPEFFTTWPPTAEDQAAFQEAMSTDDDLVLREMQRSLLSEIARIQTTATPVPPIILADTYDTWFKGWPDRTSHALIGNSPEEAFFNATNVPLREVIRMGLSLWDRTKAGDVVLDTTALEASSEPAARAFLLSNATLTLGDYRRRLARERRQGFLAHRRYTFTERPVIEVASGEYIVLRPAWLLDRLCGSQLYWQTFFDFGTEATPAGEQFSLAMNDVFESMIAYLFRRIMRRARPAITLITEPEMQDAWRNGSITPSVCDWVLVSGNTCVLVDATNHWLDAQAAQGLATPEDYSTDVEDTFVSRKFQQLMSTRQLLLENGWAGCAFNEETVFVPIVVVPNAGIPASVTADIDLKLRTGQLGPNVLSPGILTYQDLQLLEGICEHRTPRGFVPLLAKWREVCTSPAPFRLQTFLDLCGVDRPVGSFIFASERKLIAAAQTAP